MIKRGESGRVEGLVIGLRTAVIACFFVCTLVGAQVGTNISLGYRMQALEDKIVGRGPDGWHRPQMRLWCSETARLNKTWTPANVDSIKGEFSE